MNDLATTDLAILALAGDRPDEPPGSYSAMDLGERLEMGADTLADRVALLSALSELEGSGLVAECETDDGTEYELTDEGRSRASELYEEVSELRIEIRNGTAEQVPIADVDEYLPEPAMTRALARMTEDGVLFLEEDVDREFVNREAELATIEEQFDAVREGIGRALLITGEAGVGKTYLQEETQDRFAEEALVMSGVARGDTEQPYQVVREAIEGHLSDSPFDRPELDPDEPDDLQNFRLSLFADIADQLLKLADREGPLVIFLDDLHNADEPTIELVEFLGGRIKQGPVLLVGLSRLEGFEEHPIADLQSTWESGESSHHLSLASFDRGLTQELIEATLGTRRLPAKFVDLVYERTGGTPLFVAEICSQMQDANVLIPDHDVFPTDSGEVPTSETVEETIETRLEALDDVGETVLATAALLGEEFRVVDLEGALAIDPGTIREYIDLLVDIGVCQWVADGDDRRLRFMSGLFRETVVDRIPDEEAIGYHQRIVDALTGRRTEDAETTARIAHHYQQAGDTDQALSYWLEAAAHAESVYAQEVARDHYQRALAIARDRDDEEAVLDILEAIGEISLLIGDHEEARRAFEYVRNEAEDPERRQHAARMIGRQQIEWDGEPGAALETLEAALAESVDEPPTTTSCELRIQRGKALGLVGEFEESFDALEEAIELAKEIDAPAVQAEALMELVGQQAMHLEIDEGTLEHAQTAVEIFESIGDDRKLAGGLTTLGLAHDGLANEAQSNQAYQRAIDLFREVGDRRGALVAEYNLSTRTTRQALYGDYPVEDAIDEVEAVIEEARLLGNNRGLIYAIGLRGGLAWRGDYEYENAVEYLEESLAISTEIEEVRMILSANFVLAWVHEAAGDFETARVHAEEATELSREAEVGAVSPSAFWIRGRIARLTGENDTALDAYREGVEMAADGEHLQAELFARAGLVQGLVAAGDLDEAAEVAEWMEEYLAGEIEGARGPASQAWFQSYTKPEIEARIALGKLARAEDDEDQALRYLEEALESSRAYEDRLRSARILFELAETAGDVGEDYVEEALASTADLGIFGEELQRRYADGRSA